MQPISRTLTLAGVRIRYLAAGDDPARPPLMLLHGGGTDSAMLSWGGLIGPLSQRRRVYAPDMPGYGDSDRPAAAPYTLDYFADVVLRFADSLGIDCFDVAGISMGGGISLTLALSQPERIRRMILVDTYGLQTTYPPHFASYLLVRIPFLTDLTYLTTRNRAMARATLGQLIKTPSALTEDLVDEIVGEARKPRTGKAFNAFQKHEVLRDRLRTNYMPRLDQVTAPTLIVHGSADTLVPLNLAKEACWLIPDCRLVVFEGAGHWAQRERPGEFIAAVEEFLA
ncbi:MAG: alpha/beta fold hydrolase [Anaerolineae bacterium]|jgi:pimeloyl-ACP methyl ester carboxylesterase|nr:alpha/beta fold hydrolase [Anaerolineae bacterium]